MVVETKIPGLFVHSPRRYSDDRGFFCEPFRELEPWLAPASDDRDAHVFSQHRVLRGLHYTVEAPSPKRVWVSAGCVYDVVVDLRQNSPTFRQWLGFHLDAADPKVLVIPAGLAHGYCVLSAAGAHVHYKLGGRYDPSDEAGLAWNDPSLSIEWPLTNVIFNARDASWPCLADNPRLPTIIGRNVTVGEIK